ncbi:MAG TPA: hypothetical protein PL110_05220 [Candidatus Eremiobacteraeota bacterium]|nr:MAG: hypothetical protein BWY64_00493 [bacterium ADurb.Bin363]HPZ07492.1 hypothetical protein [Candidatus Eremiobacteraeota bacterium]
MKTITMKVSEQEHKEFKILATKRGGSIKDLILHCIKQYKESGEADDYEFEELDEEDLKDLEQADREYEAGEYKTFTQLKEEYKCQ